MSGGHWDYGKQLEDDQEALERVLNGQKLLKGIEHELDWGMSCDSCLECAKLRVLAALEQFFDDRMEASAAIDLLNDPYRNECVKCHERRSKYDKFGKPLAVK